MARVLVLQEHVRYSTGVHVGNLISWHFESFMRSNRLMKPFFVDHFLAKQPATASFRGLSAHSLPTPLTGWICFDVMGNSDLILFWQPEAVLACGLSTRNFMRSFGARPNLCPG